MNNKYNKAGSSTPEAGSIPPMNEIKERIYMILLSFLEDSSANIIRLMRAINVDLAKRKPKLQKAQFVRKAQFTDVALFPAILIAVA